MFAIIHNKIWYTKSKDLKISYSGGKRLLENTGERDINIICLQPLRFQKNYLNISFNGELVKGSGIELRLYNRARYLWGTADLNAYTTLPAISPEPYPTLLYHFKYVLSSIKITP